MDALKKSSIDDALTPGCAQEINPVGSGLEHAAADVRSREERKSVLEGYIALSSATISR
jgi:hypothetical protein